MKKLILLVVCPWLLLADPSDTATELYVLVASSNVVNGLLIPIRGDVSNVLGRVNDLLAREHLTTNSVLTISGGVVSEHNTAQAAHPDIRASVSNSVLAAYVLVATNQVKKLYEPDFVSSPVFSTLSNGVFRQYYTVPACTNNVITVSPGFNANGIIPPPGLALGPIVFGESIVVDGWYYQFPIGIGGTYLVKDDCRWYVGTSGGRTTLTPDPATLAEGTGYVWPDGNPESFVASDLFYTATSPVKYPLVFDGSPKYFPAAAYVRNGILAFEDNTIIGTPGHSELKIGANGKISLYNTGYLSCTEFGNISIGTRGSLTIDEGGDLSFRPGSTFSADTADLQFYGSTIAIDEYSSFTYKGFGVATSNDLSTLLPNLRIYDTGTASTVSAKFHASYTNGYNRLFIITE